MGEFPEQYSAKLTEDGHGGVIVSYIDRWADIWPQFIIRLRVQRVDSTGNFLWGSTGVRVTLAETNQGDQAIVSDGVGGCIVAWVDTLGDLRINRIDHTGARIWGDSGKYVWNSPARPPMVNDRNGGCFLMYGIGRLQRYGPTGNPYWPPSGILIPTAAIEMRVDDSLTVCLFGQRVLPDPSQSTLNLQKVSVDGNLLWDSLGIVIDTVNTYTLRSVGLSLGNKLSSLTWIDEIGSYDELWTQVVRANGSTIFPVGGQRVSRIVSTKGLVGVLPSDSTSTLYVWLDYRSPRGTYAQRLDTLGQALWDTGDVLVSVPDMSYTKAVTDGNAGLIIVGSRENFSIRAQQISRYGVLGQVITSIEDNAIHDLPKQTILFQNYPNPFNSQTIIRFQLPLTTQVDLALYNILGQKIKTFVAGVREGGSYVIILQAHDLLSGVYFYRLKTPQAILSHKLIIIK